MGWNAADGVGDEGDGIMKTKKSMRTLAEFEERHGQPKLREMERRLAAEHRKVEALAGVQNVVHVETRKDCQFVFGLLGDRHYGSLYHDGAAEAAFCEYAAKHRGVQTFFDAGDILDGHRIYKGQEFELRDVGVAKQIERLQADASRFGVTKFITGNHDGSFKEAAGVPVGQMIADARKDFVFLGEDTAQVRFETPNGAFVLQLLHPGGGTAYALSYRPQKIVESLAGGTKPDLLAIGHFHKAEMIPTYRNVCAVQVGTFQKQTPFMTRKGLSAHVGGWIIEVTVGPGHNTMRGEFVAFYV